MIPDPVQQAGQVRSRLIPFDQNESELARLLQFLSADELRRGDRLRDKTRRERFLAGRGMLREALAEILGEEPGCIRISEGEFGKPYLSDHLEPDSISFNLSHAGSYLLAAFAAGCEVGVDLEQVRQDLPYRAMAERFFSQREQEDLFSLAPQEQLAAFYRCWTRKEAYLKATGTGFSRPSNSFDVSLLPHHAPALLAHRGSPAEIDRWRIMDLCAPQGYCAAVAVENPPG